MVKLSESEKPHLMKRDYSLKIKVFHFPFPPTAFFLLLFYILLCFLSHSHTLSVENTSWLCPKHCAIWLVWVFFMSKHTLLICENLNLLIKEHFTKKTFFWTSNRFRLVWSVALKCLYSNSICSPLIYRKANKTHQNVSSKPFLQDNPLFCHWSRCMFSTVCSNPSTMWLNSLSCHANTLS